MQKQLGTVTVELAIVGSLFFLLLLAVIEVGRVMYTMNALNEATRLGARAASVCQVQHGVIKDIATFNGGGLLGGLETSHITVNYLDENGNVVADPSPSNEFGFLQVRYVKVEITGFTYNMMLPGVGALTLPTFSTTLSRESLGIIPN